MPNNNVDNFVNNHFYEQDYRSKWTSDGFGRLKTYLGNVEKGQPNVYTAPFAKGVSTEMVLKQWMSELESIRDTWPTLWDFENGLAEKVGPLSVQKPLRDRFSDIAHYYEDILLSSKPLSDTAINEVLREWAGLSGLQLRNQRETVERMKKSTNSGNPFFTKRRNVVLETTPCATFNSDLATEMDVRLALRNLNSAEWGGCAVIGWRGQEGGIDPDDVKQRVVWMFPFSVNINELQVYQPMIEGAQRLNLIPAWVSMDAVDKEITRLFDSKAPEDLVVCTDFSRFDQHFNQDLQNCANTIIARLLARNRTSKTWLDEVFPVKYGIDLCWEAHTEHIKLRKRDGTFDEYDKEVCTYFQGKHGMASGSGGTNCDETLVHRALQYEAALNKGQKLNPHSQCLGDDGILSYPGITVDDVVASYSSHGQECNPDKQYASIQDCIYLRRWHHQNYRENGVCVGVYSTCRALGRLRYLERFMDPEYWTPEMVALRQLSILENCNHHPLRNQFAQFCMKRDKYRLGIDIPGFLDNVAKYAVEAIDHMPDFLGYTKTLQGFKPLGIQDWWIVKYLKSVR